MKIPGFKNTNIYIAGKGICKTSLIVMDGKIKDIGNAKGNLIELEDQFIVVPGFIDKHIHGANGADFMNPTLEDIEKIVSSICKEGTTSCLATTMTQSKEKIIQSLQNIAKYIERKPTGIEILGVHLEGPFISPNHAGAQPKEFIIPCNMQVFEEFNQAAAHTIKQVTIAYEENGKDFTKEVTKQGVLISLGHTDCTYDLTVEAISQGASSISHMFNAMREFHHRDGGIIGAAFLHNELNCELICDLIHVSSPVIQILHKNKPKEKICLITDSMEAKWMPDGVYHLGGQKVIVKDNEARLEDGTLAGSTLKMNEAIHNFMNATGISFTEAIDYATLHPAQCLHIEDRKGSIEIGKDADLVVIDKDFTVYMTICRGEVVYSKL